MATQARLVTPERVLYEGEAEFVVMRTEGGEIMFLPNHAPFVGAVDITVLRIAPAGTGGLAPPGTGTDDPGSAGSRSAREEVRAAVHGGYVHVADNVVLVLAGVAELADEIDVPRAQRALERAEAALAERGEQPSVMQAAQVGLDGGVPGANGSGRADAGSQAGEVGEQSPTMLALLYPDDPAVAARRARARLEAAGVPDQTTATATAPAH